MSVNKFVKYFLSNRDVSVESWLSPKNQKSLLNVLAEEQSLKGVLARKKWSVDLDNCLKLSVDEFNNMCGGVFKVSAEIQLDISLERQTTIMAIPEYKDEWMEKVEKIYLLVKDDYVVKIGGTRTGMSTRFGSYLCGHHVIERGCKGKMSQTNAIVYHTIENDILKNGGKWEVYTWTLPVRSTTAIIFNNSYTFQTQTFHIYESITLSRYYDRIGENPVLSKNSFKIDS
jgi:hypothetical protein